MTSATAADEPLRSRHDERRSRRHEQLIAWARRVAPERVHWTRRNSFYYEDDRRYMRFLVPEGLRVLELGCGTGDLLAALRPSVGVGVDISPDMIEIARRSHPEHQFVVGNIEDTDTIDRLEGPFDVIGYLEDCLDTLGLVQRLCHADTRVVISYFSQTWRPLLKVAELVGQKMPQPAQSWLGPDDIDHLLRLQGFDTVRREWRLLVPRGLGGLARPINRYLGSLPGLRRLSLRHYVVARSTRSTATWRPSASVIIPCRNEAGNIEPAIRRLPRFCDDLEVVFVEGHSRDGTLDEIRRVAASFPEVDIKVAQQAGKGKADAVRTGFDLARGEVLIILDADLTVAPEDMGKFYDVIASGRGEYVQGTRLVYPLEPGAMRPLNFAANQAFAKIFSWLLNQRITDTLCGTKVISARHYAALKRGRDYFGDFDPFGDFDLIFGAAKLNLKIVEVPVRYADRSYGSTQISRFKDGLLLARMVAFAFRKLKAV